MSLSRREFLRAGVLVGIPVLVRGVAAQGTPQQGSRPADSSKTAADPLDDPTLGGRASAPLGPLDNDPGVIAIERRLRCTCGCTLDVYTCRTTDFSCTYSPAMHQEVVQGVQGGRTPEQIVATFVSREGQSVLMSPPAHGFNLAGYLVPGFAMAAVGLALAAWLSRRRPADVAVATPGAAPSPATPDAEQLDRLRRALDEVDS